jgi:hypothetical protein
MHMYMYIYMYIYVYIGLYTHTHTHTDTHTCRYIYIGRKQGIRSWVNSMWERERESEGESMLCVCVCVSQCVYVCVCKTWLLALHFSNYFCHLWHVLLVIFLFSPRILFLLKRFDFAEALTQPRSPCFCQTYQRDHVLVHVYLAPAMGTFKT